MERTGIIITHFYSTTDVHANSLTQRRQNRTTAEENQDIEISRVRRSQVRKNLNWVVCEGRKAHGGWDVRVYEVGRAVLRYHARSLLYEQWWGSLNELEHEVSGSGCFNCHILFIWPLCTNKYLHWNFQWVLYCLLVFAVPALVVKYGCRCHIKEPKQFTIIFFPRLFFPFN